MESIELTLAKDKLNRYNNLESEFKKLSDKYGGLSVDYLKISSQFKEVRNLCDTIAYEKRVLEDKYVKLSSENQSLEAKIKKLKTDNSKLSNVNLIMFGIISTGFLIALGVTTYKK